MIDKYSKVTGAPMNRQARKRERIANRVADERKPVTPFGEVYGLFVDPKGVTYFAVQQEIPGFPGKPIKRWVPIRTLRKKQVASMVPVACALADEGKLSPEHLEQVLDWLMADLNRRLNE